MNGEFCAVRSLTERLAAPLSAEDQTVQSMPDASPTKWHRAHTTWFFETFVLGPGHTPYDERFGFLFNSYYEAVGARHARPERGLITRPGITEIADTAAHVDAAVLDLIDGGVAERTAALLELGVHHEQQHQELLVMDIHHALSRNPLRPPYGELPWSDRAAGGRNRVDRPRRRHRRDRARRRRLRLRQRGAAPRRAAAAVPDRRITRHVRRLAGLHGRRRVPAAGPVDVRRLVHGPGPGLGGAAVLGARR